MSEMPRFPLFVSLAAKPVLIVGGGAIASRRARVLLEFGAAVTVVSPDISPEIQEMLDRVRWRREHYTGLDQAYFLVIAATNQRAVNRRIAEDANQVGIPVSVADCKEESTFWFPAVMRGGGLVAGMVSENGDHGAVKQAAQQIRKCLEDAL